jgi:hypothetical protein
MKRILPLIATLLFSACSIDVDYHMPAARFSIPETTGGTLKDLKVKGKAQINTGSSHKITLGEVYSFLVFNISPNVSTGASLDKTWAFGAKADLSLLESLDIFYRAVYDSPDLVGLKLQLIGKPATAKEEGFKLAISGAWGSSEKDEGTLTLNGNGNPDRTYNATIDIDVWDVSLLAGYRFNKSGLFYLNGFYSYYDTDGELTSNTFSPEKVGGASRSYGGLLGLHLTTANGAAFFNIEAGATHARWEDQLDTTSFTSGGSLGFYF